MKAKTIKVDTLARVEGEGALYVKIKGDKVMDVKLKIYEPPRFFEALLRGRMYAEAPDITAHLWHLSSGLPDQRCTRDGAGTGCHGWWATAELRRLLYCGEWMESHRCMSICFTRPTFLGIPT